MSDQPLTLSILAKFHREVIVPDIERIVGDAVSGAESRLRDQMQTLHDGLLQGLNTLEIEYELLKVGLARVEQRLDLLEADHKDLVTGLHRLDERLSRVEKGVDELVAAREKDTLRAEVADLRARVDALQAQIGALEKRLEG